MGVTEIERFLEGIEQLESYNKEEQANFIAAYLAQLVTSMPKEQLVSFFRSWILRNPDTIDHWIDFLKSKALKQYREAIKMARRRVRIKFK